MPTKKKPLRTDAVTIRLRPDEMIALKKAADALEEDTRVTVSSLARRLILQGLRGEG